MLWLESQTNAVQLWRDLCWVHFVYCYVLFRQLPTHTPLESKLCEKTQSKAWPPKLFFNSNSSCQHLNVVFETTSQTTGPGYVDRRSLLWSLHTKQAFSLLPLCAFCVNRHPRGQHVLGHLLFCSLESPTWPTNTLTSLVSQRNFHSKTILFFYQNIVFSRTKWGEKPSQCQGQLSKQQLVSINGKVELARVNRSWPHLTCPPSNMVKAKSPTLPFTAKKGKLFNSARDVFLPQDVPRRTDPPLCV